MQRKRIAILLGLGMGSDDSLEIIGAYPTRSLAEEAKAIREREDHAAGRRSIYEIALPSWHTEAQSPVQH